MGLICKLTSTINEGQNPQRLIRKAKGASPTILTDIDISITKSSKQRYFEPKRYRGQSPLHNRDWLTRHVAYIISPTKVFYTTLRVVSRILLFFLPLGIGQAGQTKGQITSQDEVRSGLWRYV